MSNGAPFFYDYINAETSRFNPSTIHCTNTKLSRFFQRELLQTAMSVFRFTLPKTWNRDYFLYCLYCWGYLAIVNTDKYGVIPQGCGLRGYDVFYSPAYAVIANPLISGTLEPRIGTQCTLIKLQPDFGGIMDTVYYYADMMALCAESAATNTLAAKLAYVFTAKNKSAAESFKKMLDNIASGEIGVVIDRDLIDPTTGRPTWEMFNTQLRNAYIAPDLLENLIKWKQRFCTEIGVPNTNTTKKERLTDDEVNANNVETQTRCALWLESLQQSFEEARNMFGISESELSVDWRFDNSGTQLEGGVSYEE